MTEPIKTRAWLTETDQGDMLWLDHKEASAYTEDGEPIALVKQADAQAALAVQAAEIADLKLQLDASGFEDMRNEIVFQLEQGKRKVAEIAALKVSLQAEIDLNLRALAVISEQEKEIRKLCSALTRISLATYGDLSAQAIAGNALQAQAMAQAVQPEVTP